MRYISDDGKVFNTEQECCKYEQQIEKDRQRKEKLEMERQNRLDTINKKYEELQKLLSEYERDYVIKQRPYVAPFYKSMDIYEFLLEANRLNVTSSKSERLELQTKAITSCDKLSCFVEMSLNLNIIGSNTVENWQKQINDIKYMTIAWRQKDKERK